MRPPPAMNGPVASNTTTVSSRSPTWAAVARLPEPSIAVHVIVVTPPGNGAESAAPSLRTPVSVTPVMLSVAVVPRLPTSAAH